MILKNIIEFIRQLVRIPPNLLSVKDKEPDQKNSLLVNSIKQSQHYPYKNKNKVLSNQELKYLVEKAESYIDSNNLVQALKIYTQLIENFSSQSHYLKKRALTYRMMGEFNAAISDMDKAIELDPDDAVSYWERGACYAHKLSLLKDISKNEKTHLLEKILKDYKASVEREPTSSAAWLAILETDMLLQNWDDAISNYGSCKPYIDTKEYQLVRSWLGCLSLIFADESIEDEDMKSLNDCTIRLNRGSWCVSEIDSLFIELENEKLNKEKLKIAEEIHKRFLDHFDEPPMRFNNH